MIETFEAGDTVQFTFTSSVAPDSAPRLAIYGSGDTLVSSLTAASSSATAYFAMITMPASADGQYKGEWFAQKTVASIQYPFNKRFLFNVMSTKRRD